jgi:hypothetical protein
MAMPKEEEEEEEEMEVACYPIAIAMELVITTDPNLGSPSATTPKKKKRISHRSDSPLLLLLSARSRDPRARSAGDRASMATSPITRGSNPTGRSNAPFPKIATAEMAMQMARITTMTTTTTMMMMMKRTMSKITIRATDRSRLAVQEAFHGAPEAGRIMSLSTKRSDCDNIIEIDIIIRFIIIRFILIRFIIVIIIIIIIIIAGGIVTIILLDPLGAPPPPASHALRRELADRQLWQQLRGTADITTMP